MIVSVKSPNSIPGLKVWLDASDANTINNGREISNGSIVQKWVDKAGGYVFRSGTGTLGNSYGFLGANGTFKVRGPSYSIGVVNGKNAITFNYYTGGGVGSGTGGPDTEDNISFRRLACGPITPVGSSTYSMYVVFLPKENREQKSIFNLGAYTGQAQAQYVMTVMDSTRANNGGVGLLSGYPAGYSERMLYMTSTNSVPGNFFRNGTIGYLNASNETTVINGTTPTIGTYLSLQGQDQPTAGLVTSGKDYQYGKVNVYGMRFNNLMKKLTVMRNGYVRIDNFITRATWSGGDRRTSPSPSIANPVMTIGAITPGYDLGKNGLRGIGDDGTNGTPTSHFTNQQPFEGYFCEFLFWDRVLSDSESNSIELYLRKKWIG